jgi:hypothetical protein
MFISNMVIPAMLKAGRIIISSPSLNMLYLTTVKQELLIGLVGSSIAVGWVVPNVLTILCLTLSCQQIAMPLDPVTTAEVVTIAVI